MAQSTNDVDELLMELLTKTRPQAEAEFKKLKPLQWMLGNTLL